MNELTGQGGREIGSQRTVMLTLSDGGVQMSEA
jgi:hypothetical protein